MFHLHLMEELCFLPIVLNEMVKLVTQTSKKQNDC